MFSEKPSSTTKSNYIIIFIAIILLTASTVLNVLLAQKINALTSVIDEIKTESRLNEGENAPLFEAKDLNGNSVTFSFSDVAEPTVLYVFTPQCHWCSENLDNLQLLAKETRGRYRLFGVSLNNEGLENYLQKNGLNFPIYKDIPTHVKSAYKLGGTPQTIVISPEGRVIKNWVGVYTDEVASEVEDYFKIRLPGLINKES